MASHLTTIFPTVSSSHGADPRYRGTLETKFGAVWVQGEISNYNHPVTNISRSDQRAQIACDFPQHASSARDALADGAQVQVYGNVSFLKRVGTSAQRPDFADSRRRAFASEIRCTQTQTRGRRSLRFREETRVAEISGTHWHCHVAERRGDPRHAKCFAPTRTGHCGSDQSRARAGIWGSRGNRCGHSRTSTQ